MSLEEIIKQQDLKFLKNALDKDEYKEALFNRMFDYDFKKDEIKFCKKYLKSQNFKIKSFVIRLLCKNNFKLYDFMKYLDRDERLLDDFIEIAERNKDEDVLLELLDEEHGKVLNVIIAIKNIGRKDLLTSLMFSENE